MEKDTDTLRQAFELWSSAADFRARRDRFKRFTYGEQWSDPVDDGTGCIITEGELARRNNHRPITNNLLRQMVKTIVGRYRNIAAESGMYDSDAGSTDALNSMSELDARLLEEFVISGCAVQRIVAERRPGGSGVWVDNVDPRSLFVNPYRDPRGHDITFIGQMHDLTWPEIVNRFGGGSRSRIAHLRQVLDSCGDMGNASAFAPEDLLGVAVGAQDDFFVPRPGHYRVLETWTLEGRPVSVRGRMRMDMVWTCRWLAPDGTVLLRHNSTRADGSHPFVIKLYPLTDGEVHSFVEDVIDQQKSINRVLVLIDAMMATSAKGALIFPIDQLPRNMKIDDVAEQWASPDGVILVNGQGRAYPQQIHTNPADSGAYLILETRLKMMEDITGVGDTLLGRNVAANTGSALYDARVRNASLAITDLLESFIAFVQSRNRKIAKCRNFKE